MKPRTVIVRTHRLGAVFCLRHRCLREARKTLTLKLAAALSLVLALLPISTARALIVGNIPDLIPETTVNPATYYSFENADPGWDNTSALGSNYVYLGDGWVLSARHVGYNAASGVNLQTYLPDGTPGPVKSFKRIPGSYYHDYGYGSTDVNTRQYAVSNPTSITSETGSTIFLTASDGTYFTDLQLFRISEDPGLPAVTLATQPMPSNFIRSNAPEVVVIGNGRSRVAAETHWNVSGSTWTETTDSGTHQGYYRDAVQVKRFGTNRLTDIRPNFSGDPSDPGATNYTQAPTNVYNASDVISDTTGAFALQTADGVTRDIISMMTVFNRQTDVGATPLEVQVTSGNSGSSVFYNRGTAGDPQWELVGIVHARWAYNGQPADTAVYGNHAIVSDLWQYIQNYDNSIREIIESHPNYSHLGDINLNGIVSGDGTGAWASDDVSAFVAGWGYDNHTGLGTLTSWRNGDLTRDGKTNVQDFLVLREALNGQIPAAAIAALFGDGEIPGTVLGVPEPSSVALAMISAGCLLLGARRRGSRPLR